MRKVFSILLLLFYVTAWSQDTAGITIEQLSESGILLDKGWKFQAGDNSEWAKPEFVDHAWKPIDPTLDIRALPQLWNTNIIWFRLHFRIDSALTNQGLNAIIEQNGASEIYLIGQQVGRFGFIHSHPMQVKAASPVLGSFIPFPVSKFGEQVIAVRNAVQKGYSVC